MCIIVVKRAGINLPTKDTLKVCFENNSDGAGIAYREGKLVKIEKGFMNFESLWKILSERDFTDTDMILHFRISTGGGKKAGLTHPYPVTNRIESMLLLEQYTERAFFHNGVIGGLNEPKHLNDTIIYITEVLYPLLKKVNLRNPLIESVLSSTSSKFGIIDGAGIITVGNFTDVGGILYSNNSYKKKAYTSSLSSSYYNNSWESDYYNKGYAYEQKRCDVPIRAMAFIPKEGTIIDVVSFDDVTEDFPILYLDEEGTIYTYDSVEGLLIPLYMYDCSYTGDAPVFNSKVSTIYYTEGLI